MIAWLRRLGWLSPRPATDDEFERAETENMALDNQRAFRSVQAAYHNVPVVEERLIKTIRSVKSHITKQAS